MTSNILYTTETLVYRYRQKGGLLYIVVLLFLLLAFCLLPFITIEVSTQSTGIIRAKQENAPIYTVVNGKITYLNLANNQSVRQGDTLLMVEEAVLEVQNESNRQVQSQLYTRIRDLSALSSGGGSLSTPEYQRAYSSYQQQIQELQTTLRQRERDYNRTQKLHQEGVIPAAEYEEKLYALENAQATIASRKQQQISQWAAERRQVEQEIKNLSGSINRIEQERKNYMVTAPISGTVINYNGLLKGAYIAAEQPLAEIASEQNLIVECSVSPKDIGLLQVGQSVKFQVDAYNYNDWGMATGKVMEIDKNITLDNQTQSAYFKVRCHIQTKELQLKNGYKAQLKKGMTLTARFYVNTRSLWQLLYDKVDDWLNPKIN